MDDSVEQVNVAVEQNTDKLVLDWLEELDEIEIVSTDDPVHLVEEGEALVAVSADENFSLKLENNEMPEVIVQADPTSTKGEAPVI